MNNNTESQADYFRVVGTKTEHCKHCGFINGHALNCIKHKQTGNQCASQITIGITDPGYDHSLYYPNSTVKFPGACHSAYYPDSNIKIVGPTFTFDHPAKMTKKPISYREQILIDALKKAKKELQVFNMGTQFVDDVVGLFE